jgi:hypothetical protein
VQPSTPLGPDQVNVIIIIITLMDDIPDFGSGTGPLSVRLRSRIKSNIKASKPRTWCLTG